MDIKVANCATSYEFLSTSSLRQNGKMEIKWLNKNRETIDRNEQKIIRFLHAKSFTPNYSKQGAMYSQFLRVSRNSDRMNLLPSMNELEKEYKILNYKILTIKRERQKVETNLLNLSQDTLVNYS